MDYRIQWATSRDLSSIYEIEKESFEYNWSFEQLCSTIKINNVIALVLNNENDCSIGYIIYQLNANSLTILNLAVGKDYRRQGCGKLLIDKMISKLLPGKREALIATIRESNLPAQLFFKKMGFYATAILNKPFDENDEDAYLMKYKLNNNNRIKSMLNPHYSEKQ